MERHFEPLVLRTSYFIRAMESAPLNIPTINARLIEKVTLHQSVGDHSSEGQFAQIWVDTKAKFVQITVQSNQDSTVVVYFQNDRNVAIFVGSILCNSESQIITLPADTPVGNYAVGVVSSTQTYTGSFSIM